MNLLVLSVLVFIGYSSAEKLRFDNFTLYRFTPRDDRQVNVLKNMEESGQTGYDFWTSARSIGSPVDVLVPPHRKNEIKSLTQILGMDTEVLMENIQKQIDEERSSLRLGAFDWSSYRTLDEINQWLRTLAQQHPGVVTLLKGGKTYEKREILGVKVSFSPHNENNSVWIDSNIHAREWISGAVNTFILNELLTNKHIRKVAESHDWYIFPVINPDGYVYTFTNNRLWRKTRTPHSQGCFGVDPNRNWDYKWNQGGSSNDPCDETYAGPKAFSDLSTSSLSKYISKIASKLKVYISFHSYSQMILLPYGHTSEHLDNYNVTYPIGEKAAKSLAKRYGTKYVVGNIPEILCKVSQVGLDWLLINTFSTPNTPCQGFQHCIPDELLRKIPIRLTTILSSDVATGSSMDWIKGVHRIPVALTYELRDTGRHGFLLPENQIIPTALETLDSVVTIVKEAGKIIGTP